MITRYLMSSTFKNHTYSGANDIGIVCVKETGGPSGYSSTNNYFYVEFCDFYDNSMGVNSNAGLKIVDNATGSRNSNFRVYYSRFHDNVGKTIIDLYSTNITSTTLYLNGSASTSSGELFGYDNCYMTVSNNDVADCVINVVASTFVYLYLSYCYVEGNESGGDIIYYNIPNRSGNAECVRVNGPLYVRYNRANDKILDINGGNRLFVYMYSSYTYINYNESVNETLYVRGGENSQLMTNGQCSYNVITGSDLDHNYVQKFEFGASSSISNGVQEIENNFIKNEHNATMYIKTGQTESAIICGTIRNGYGSLCGGVYIANTDSADLTINGIFERCTYTGSQGMSAIYFGNPNRNVEYSSCSFTRCNKGFDSQTIQIGNSTYTRPAVYAKEEDHVSISNYNASYNISFTSCTFSYNSSKMSGGALYVGIDDNISINSCDFSYNSTDGKGGALYLEKDITLSGCSFSNNTAKLGGGAIYSCADLTIQNSGIYGIRYNKTTNGNGGAILIESAAELNVSGAKIFGNKAENGNGGAIYTEGASTFTDVGFG